MRRRMLIVALVTALVTPLGSLIWGTPAALAFNCSGASDSIQLFNWTRPNEDVWGIRAPVQTRLDGGLCDNTTASDAFGYVGLRGINSGDLVAIGMAHMWVNGQRLYCRFWGKTSGNPITQPYNCGDDSNFTYVYFMIHQWIANGTYILTDCGTAGGYQNCNPQDTSQPLFAHPYGTVEASTPKGCDTHIMGDQTDKQNIGNNAYFVQGLALDGWSARTNWNPDHVGCITNYHKVDQSDHIFLFYDDRNAQ